MPTSSCQVVVVGLDAAPDAVHDGFEVAELADAGARPAQRTSSSSQPSGGGCSTDGSPTTIGARERRFPTVAQRARAQRDVLARAEQPFGRQPGGRATVDRRGDGFERGRRDAERGEAFRAHAAQHARAHAVAEERGHRREPVARDARGFVHGRDLLGRWNAPELGEDRAGVDELGAREGARRRARTRPATCRRRRRCARRSSPGIARSASSSFAGFHVTG